jgi:hypothetical protein
LITAAEVERAKSATQITTRSDPKVTHFATPQAARTEHAPTLETQEKIEENAVFPAKSRENQRRGQDSNLRTSFTRSVH